MVRLTVVAVFGLGILLASVSRAADTMSYQGLVQNPNGSPRNGTVEILVRLWDAPTGGNILWSELHPVVNLVDGVFALELGSVNTALPTVMKGHTGDLWLGVTVNAEDLLPRQKLQTVGRAFRAATVDDGAIKAKHIGEACLDGQVLVQTSNGWECGNGQLRGCVLGSEWRWGLPGRHRGRGRRCGLRRPGLSRAAGARGTPGPTRSAGSCRPSR